MPALVFSFLLSQFTEMREASGIDYVNVTGERQKRFIASSLGTGAALFDYDQDGDLDLYLVNGASIEGKEIGRGLGNRLYRNQGDWRFEDRSREAGVDLEGFGQGSATGDIDNDGFPDLYVTQIGANVLYRNRGDGTFEDVSASADVGHEGFSTSAAFFDADSDSDLDLYVANYVRTAIRDLPLPGEGPHCRWLALPVFCGPNGLEAAPDVYFRNEGDGRFTEETEAAGLLPPAASYGLGVVAGDIDGDGDADVYVANDSMPNFLFLNDGRGSFTEAALFSGVAYSSDGLAQAGMGVDMGDLDSDGELDIFVTNFSHDTNTAYRNVGGGVFEDATTELNLRMASWFYLGWATRFVDLDLDGDEDLFVANGHVYPEANDADEHTSYAQRNQIFWNQGRGPFVEGEFPREDAMADSFSSRGAAFGDVDDDGDFDAAIVNIDDPPSLLRNDISGGNWIGLKLVGTESNRDGIGARVFVSSGPLRQMKEVHTSGSFLSASDSRLLFGLGARQAAEEIRIRWPSGVEETLENVAAGRYLVIVETRSPSRE